MRFLSKLLCYSMILVLLTLVSCSNQDVQINEIINMDETNIEKISLDIPGRKGDLKSTTNQDEIVKFMTYLEEFSYDKIRGDAQSYMPKLAAIIYIYGEETDSFIVPYGTEIMIDQHVYGLDPKQMDLKFFEKFYNELE